jgi:Transglutaminase-like superfamily
MARVRGSRRWHAGLVGAVAALRVPLSLGGGRLTLLLRPTRAAADESVTPTVSTEDVALAGGLPASRRPWRNSCLYRSVAQTHVLRAYGRTAHVALGAGRVEADTVGAHAWVVYDGPEMVEQPTADFVVFRSSAAPRSR